MIKNIFTILLLFALPFGIMAQTAVSGTVTDAESGDPLVGVSIVVQGTTNGVSTDFDGRYTITIENDVTLMFSYIGYTSISEAVQNTGGAITLDKSMEVDGLQLEAVIVTANKKSESAQKVPMSVSVLGTKELARLGATDFETYAIAIPNLTFGTQGSGGGGFGQGRNTNQISIRGISGSNTTALYLDDTPLPENVDPRVFDISRIEVLRGPQGTLYGSNTLGGAVKIVSNNPNTQTISGNFTTSTGFVSEGDTDYSIKGSINLPIVKNKLALRASGFYSFETGVLDQGIRPGALLINEGTTLSEDIAGNPFDTPLVLDGCPECLDEPIENVDDSENYGFLASLSWTPSDKITFNAKYITQNKDEDGSGMRDFSADNFTQDRGVLVNEFFEENWDFFSFSGKFQFDAGELVTSTSYFDQEYTEQEDEGTVLAGLVTGFGNPGAPPFFWGDVIQATIGYERFTHETRFVSSLEGKFNFAAGIFYSKEDTDRISRSDLPGYELWLLNPDILAGNFPASLIGERFWNSEGISEASELSLFGELYYQVSDKFKVILGMRYFDSDKEADVVSFGFPTSYEEIVQRGDFNESGVSPRFGLEVNVDENQLLFANVSRGFRLGEVNSVVPTGFCADDLAELEEAPPELIESDFLWNYEVGYKGTMAKGRLRINATAFYSDWNDFRGTRFLRGCGFSFNANLGDARSIGFEFEAQAKLSKNLKAGLGFGILDSEVLEGRPTLGAEEGDDIPFTTPFTGNFNLQYATNIGGNKNFFARYDVFYTGERTSVFDPENAPERVFENFTIMNFRAGLSFSNYELSVFAQNFTNEHANYGDLISLATEVPGRPRFATNRPRIIGLQMNASF